MIEDQDSCREAMEELVDRGLVRHLGVSNFSVKQVEELLEYARIKPVANQVELHPFLPQRKLVGVCARKVFISDCGKRQSVRKVGKLKGGGGGGNTKLGQLSTVWLQTLAMVPSVCVSIARTGLQTGMYSGVYTPDPRVGSMMNA